MPIFGAHLSVAGGLANAITSAVELGMQTVQLFTHSPSQWAVKPRADAKSYQSNSTPELLAKLRDRLELDWGAKDLAQANRDGFRVALAASEIQLPTAHDSYLINLGSPDDNLYARSIVAFLHEIDRAESLGLSYLVTHPGAHVGSGVEAAIDRISAALNWLLELRPDANVRILLETTAGQGSTLGATFEELAAILDRLDVDSRIGVCLDTCHVFAAGYDLRTPKGVAQMFKAFDSQIGLDRLKLFHLNDSVKGLGSRVDRHAGLGLGQIGLSAFQTIVTDKRFAKLPMILETPKDDADGNPMDSINLAILQSFPHGKL